MDLCKALPSYRYSACAISIWLCMGWSLPSQAACTLVSSTGNDNFVCDSGNNGPLTDLAGNNNLAFPTNGTGTITGNVTFGAGNDTLDMNSGVITGIVQQGDGSDSFTIDAGQITGAVNQGNGVDTALIRGGTIQSLAQGDSRDVFQMSAGMIIGAFEDGDTAKITCRQGRIARR
jgi:Ca2+-binding RTX toxin-like protein